MDVAQLIGEQIIIFLNRDRLIHGFKTAFACLAAFALATLFPLHSDQWLIITILVVMCAQINVGGMLQKSYMRFLGTLIGSLIAAATLLLFGVQPVVFAIVIALSALFFSYIATGQGKLNDAGTLGAVTVVIILIGQTPNITIAAHRFIEITLGIILAGAVSQFIFPIHARTRLRDSQADTIQELKKYYAITLLGNENIKNPVELDEEIVKSLIAQRKLSIDAARELIGKTFNAGHFNQYLWYAKEILRSMAFMARIYRTSPACAKLFATSPDIIDFHKTTCLALETLSSSIKNKNVELETVILPNVSTLKVMIAQQNFTNDDLTQAQAFLFCAENLCIYLQKLTELVKEF